MALLTPNEIKKLPHGLHPKYKCDVCGKPILSSLIFCTKYGGETCCSACRDRADSNETLANQIKEKVSVANKKRKDEDEEEVTKKSKKTKDEDEDEEEEETEEEEEEETEEEEEEEEEEKPKKGKKAKASKKSKKDEDEDEEEEEEEEDEEEDEKPKKGKDKKKKKSKKDDDEDDEPKKKKKVERASVGTKTNPYRDDSFIHEAFEAAKKGISVKDLQKMCKKDKVSYNWVIARFKKLEKRGVEWKYKNDDDEIKITLKK